MATSTAPTSPITRSVSTPNAMSVYLPYAVAILAQLPMLLLYFRDLWARPHYQFFPFAILATAWFAYSRWPRDLESPFRRSWISNALLVVALFCGILAVVFSTAWFSALSCMLLVTSLLIRTIDSETLGSLGIAAVPMYTCLMLPLGYDVWLITTLQRWSANITSVLLDLVGLKHQLEGVKILVPGTSGYGIEEACSGVQSFFTLLFFASVLVVFYRRVSTSAAQFAMSLLLAAALLAIAALASSSLAIMLAIGVILFGMIGLRATMLIGAAVFWALFMNTIRITTIPIAQEYFGLDLAHGIKHDLLGYIVLASGLLLLFSTDQLILYVLGPKNPDGDFFARVLKLDATKKKKRTRRKPLTKTGSGLIWGTAGVLALCGVMQVIQFGQALANPNLTIKFFDANVTTPFEKGDIPSEIGGWKQVDFSTSTRVKGSDLGMQSDSWQFRSPRCSPVVSLDQTFPGWHELTTCYRNAGWILQKRKRVELKPRSDENNPLGPWPYVEATFKKKTGEHAYLLFSLFDSEGKALDPPSTWGTVNSFFVRVKNRMNHRLRSSMFQSEAYQTQVLIQSYSELDDSLKDEIRTRYFAIREAMRTRYLQKVKGTLGTSGPNDVSVESAKPTPSFGDVFSEETPATKEQSDFPF